MVLIEPGCFKMGTNKVYDYLGGTPDKPDRPNDRERPVHKVCLDAYYMDTHEVTQEKWEKVMRYNNSVIKGKDIAVNQLDWSEAREFCAREGHRLPTEAEWEFAARGGLKQARLPWGDDLCPDGEHRCNIWTGTFPIEDTAEDGYAGTCPVDTFEPNGFGLFNCSGNVWEWCMDHFSSHHPVKRPLVDPTGPPMGVDRIAKGGSFLCHDSYCHRYRVGARLGNTPDSSTAHQGFRLAA